MNTEAPPTPYGDYILSTGAGSIADIELIWGRFWYQSRFVGQRPIADVGPGRCWFTRQCPADIVAVDNAPDLVDHFARLGLQTRLGDAYNIPFADDHLEGLFCCWLLEHLTDPERAMREFRRVLKPGARCCVIVPTPVNMEAFYTDYTHVRPFTAASLTQLSRASGFSRCQTSNFPWTRGLRHLYRARGHDAAYRYIKFADTQLRRAGLINREHLVLDAWK